MRVTTLCVAPGCLSHRPECPRDDSCLCGPRLAAKGLAVCDWHEERARSHLQELPALWEALGERPRIGPGGGLRAATPDPEVIDPDRAVAERLDPRLAARHKIRELLVRWSRVLAAPAPEGRDVRMPDESTISRWSRRAVVFADSEYQIALQAYREGHGSVEAVRLRRHEVDRARERRISGRDVIDALREHVERNLAWLLAGEYAAQLVAEVAEAARCRGLAWPSRPAVTVACPTPGCMTEGRRVRLDPDQEEIKCPRCGEWGDIEWWRRRVGADHVGPLPLSLLALWLADARGIVVTTRRIEGWAERGHLTPEVPSGRDERGRRTPALYDRTTVALIAADWVARRSARSDT